jgi:hypothetical protein
MASRDGLKPIQHGNGGGGCVPISVNMSYRACLSVAFTKMFSGSPSWTYAFGQPVPWYGLTAVRISRPTGQPLFAAVSNSCKKPKTVPTASSGTSSVERLLQSLHLSEGEYCHRDDRFSLWDLSTLPEINCSDCRDERRILNASQSRGAPGRLHLH